MALLIRSVLFLTLPLLLSYGAIMDLTEAQNTKAKVICSVFIFLCSIVFGMGIVVILSE